jgi:hypothetical protein
MVGNLWVWFHPVSIPSPAWAAVGDRSFISIVNQGQEIVGDHPDEIASLRKMPHAGMTRDILVNFLVAVPVCKKGPFSESRRKTPERPF